MTKLMQARLTVPEAAFVSGLTIRDINHEIDARIISANGKAGRRVRGADLIYLAAIKDVRTQLTPMLRRRMRRAIGDAAGSPTREARLHHFVLDLDDLERELAAPFRALEEGRAHIEQRDEVLRGEPVIKGTRIAARHIANLVKQGATSAELQEDFDLSDEQIGAAVVFDQVNPRRGRPIARKVRALHVPAA